MCTCSDTGHARGGDQVRETGGGGGGDSGKGEVSRLFVGRSLVQKEAAVRVAESGGNRAVASNLRATNDARKPKHDRSFNYQNSGNPAKGVRRVRKVANTAKKCVGIKILYVPSRAGGRGRWREGGLELNRSYGVGRLGGGGGGGVGVGVSVARSGREYRGRTMVRRS